MFIKAYYGHPETGQTSTLIFPEIEKLKVSFTPTNFRFSKDRESQEMELDNQDWFSEISQIFGWVDYKEYDQVFICITPKCYQDFKKEPEKFAANVIDFYSNKKRYLLISTLLVYVCNEQGKTIDKIK